MSTIDESKTHGAAASISSSDIRSFAQHTFEDSSWMALTSLSVTRSKLKTLSGIAKLTSLTTLNLYMNDIEDLAELTRLKGLENVVELDMRLNPVALHRDFHRVIAHVLPALKTLNNRAFNAAMWLGHDLELKLTPTEISGEQQNFVMKMRKHDGSVEERLVRGYSCLDVALPAGTDKIAAPAFTPAKQQIHSKPVHATTFLPTGCANYNDTMESDCTPFLARPYAHEDTQPFVVSGLRRYSTASEIADRLKSYLQPLKMLPTPNKTDIDVIDQHAMTPRTSTASIAELSASRTTDTSSAHHVDTPDTSTTTTHYVDALDKPSVPFPYNDPEAYKARIEEMMQRRQQLVERLAAPPSLAQPAIDSHTTCCENNHATCVSEHIVTSDENTEPGRRDEKLGLVGTATRATVVERRRSPLRTLTEMNTPSKTPIKTRSKTPTKASPDVTVSAKERRELYDKARRSALLSAGSSRLPRPAVDAAPSRPKSNFPHTTPLHKETKQQIADVVYPPTVLTVGQPPTMATAPAGMAILPQGVLVGAMEMQMTALGLLRDAQSKLMSNYDDMRDEMRRLRDDLGRHSRMEEIVLQSQRQADAVEQKTASALEEASMLRHQLQESEMQRDHLTKHAESAYAAAEEARAACAAEVLKWRQAVLELKEQISAIPVASPSPYSLHDTD